MFFDYFELSSRNLLKRKLRSWLTMLGIFVGIAAVVALISLSQGLQDTVNEQFEEIGTNRILIIPGGINFGPFSGSLTTETLTESDVGIVRKVSGVEIAAGAMFKSATFEYNKETRIGSIFGFPFDELSEAQVKKANPFSIVDGRMIIGSDRYGVVIDETFSSDAFEKELRVGNKVKINDVDFTVLGIVKSSGALGGNALRIQKIDTKELFDIESNDEVDAVFALSKRGVPVGEVAERVKKRLRSFRDVKKGEEDFTITTVEDAVRQLNTTLDILKFVLIGIAAISLIVGGIGIMNTMYTSVLERRKEIGIMKSIGGKKSDILTIFLIESGLLGSLGGIIGVILGLGISKSVQIITGLFGINLSIYMGAELIFGALIFSFLVGSLSGVLPALQAASLNPVDALKGA